MYSQVLEPSMPEFEVYYQEDEPRGWPGGWRLRGTFTRTRTAEAAEVFLKGAPGIYLVTFVGGGPANAKFWLKMKDGTIELLDQGERAAQNEAAGLSEQLSSALDEKHRQVNRGGSSRRLRRGPKPPNSAYERRSGG